jgi:hypothetical protein
VAAEVVVVTAAEAVAAEVVATVMSTRSLGPRTQRQRRVPTSLMEVSQAVAKVAAGAAAEVVAEAVAKAAARLVEHPRYQRKTDKAG